MNISKLGNSEFVNFYSPYWKFSKATTLGVLRRFVKIWGGCIIQDSSYSRIYNVIVNNTEVGWFAK